MSVLTPHANPLAACALVAAFACPIASTAHPAASSASAAVEPELKVLWDQRDGDSGIGIVAQNFEVSFDAYDSQAADDFVVPEGETWVLKAIEVQGTHFSGIGPLRSMHVSLHRPSDKRPGRPGEILSDVAEAPVESIGCEGCGSYLVHLSEPVELSSGRHWLALQGNMNFSDGSEWGWEARMTQQGKPGLWRNPGGGFGVGCTNYRPQVHCIGDFGQASDYLFALHGKRRR
jgi:hypothetical protein